MMTFSDGGKHVWLATATTEGLLARKPTIKIVEIVQTNYEGATRSRNRQTARAVTTTAHTHPVNLVLSHPCQPSFFLRLLWRSASAQPTIRAETTTRAKQVPFAPTTDSLTAVRRTRPVRRRHCRGHLLWFRKMLECLSFALHVVRHTKFVIRAHGLLRRLLTIFTA